MFMTDSVLIRHITEDRTLSNVSVLVIDEAHERSLDTDIVMALAKQLMQRRKDFRVVVASATIDEQDFLRYFKNGSAQALTTKGRLYPVRHPPFRV